MSDLIKVLIKLPGEKLEAAEVDLCLLKHNPHVELCSDVRIIHRSGGGCDPNELPDELKYNCRVCNLTFFGPIVFVGWSGKEYADVPGYEDPLKFSTLFIKGDSFDDDAVDFNDDFDAHSCAAEADSFGVCSVCGATVYGSVAYCEERGCDPPGTY